MNMHSRCTDKLPRIATHRSLLTALALCALAPIHEAHAESHASFDCAKARSRVEKLICTTPRLGDADARLYDTYHGTLQTADYATGETILREQRAWLRERDACTDAGCVEAAYTQRISTLERTPKAQWKQYRNERMGIAFDYLGSRQVVDCDEGAVPEKGKKVANPYATPARCVKLISRDMGSSDYVIAFTLNAGDLETVARKEAGFDLQDGKWVTTFGMGRSNVERFAGRNWKGMQATISCGVSDSETGYHAAGGDCYWGVMSDGKRSIVADTEGIIGNDEATKKTISSLEFLPAK